MKRLIARQFQHLYEAYERWQEDDGSLLAASVAYYAGFSLLPLLLILIAGLGIFFEVTQSGYNAREQILEAISQQMSPSLSRQVRMIFSGVEKNAKINGPIGLATLLVTSVAIFVCFETAFDRIWNVQDRRSYGIIATVRHVLLERLYAFAMLVAVGILVVTLFLAGMITHILAERSEEVLPASRYFWQMVSWGMPIFFNTIAFTLIYRVLPKVRVRWREALGGGILAAILWEIGRAVLAALLIGNRYTDAYAIVGAFIAVMLWVYYAVCVLFFGAEYIQTYCRYCNVLPASRAHGVEVHDRHADELVSSKPTR